MVGGGERFGTTNNRQEQTTGGAEKKLRVKQKEKEQGGKRGKTTKVHTYTKTATQKVPNRKHLHMAIYDITGKRKEKLEEEEEDEK